MEFSNLTPKQFENMTFDLLCAAGLKNLVWRTPGADGGRDIEGTFSAIDFSKHYHTQQWYIECKRYSSSIDWPTVWNKISFADNNNADFVLFVTNSSPSPKCETEISKWNNNNRIPIVRFWRGYELEGIMRNYPQVAAKYGMLGNVTKAEMSLQNLTFEAMKLAQSSYAANSFDALNDASLEANAALAELIFSRFSQIRTHGQTLPPIAAASAPSFEWLDWKGPANSWDEIGIRSIITMIRHLTGSERICVMSDKEQIQLDLHNVRFEIGRTGEKVLMELANWADVEVNDISKKSIILSSRR